MKIIFVKYGMPIDIGYTSVTRPISNLDSGFRTISVINEDIRVKFDVQTLPNEGLYGPK